MISRRKRRSAGVAFFSAILAVGEVSAQRPSLYGSMGVGLAYGAVTELGLSGPNSHTRCDRLLYTNPADVPAGADCAAGTEIAGRYSFDPQDGLLGHMAIGYTMSGLSIELEGLQRHQIVHHTLFTLGDLAGPAITGKDTEWSADRPPWGDISEFRARQLFANAFYALPTIGYLRPYIGVGGGLSRVDFRSSVGFQRKSITEGYLEVFGGSRTDPGASPDWQRAAAGTVSELSTDVSESGFGFQLLAGFDYPMGREVSLGLRGRWVRIPDASVDALWTTIRSHAPVHADGVTPFVSRLDFSSLGYWAVTVSVKYRLPFGTPARPRPAG